LYTLKSEVFPSFFIILLGSIDAITTAVGVYFGAAELNPFLRGIVSTSIAAFLAVKISATFLIGFTFILARRTLNKALNKESRSFKISNRVIKVAYAGLLCFLIVVVLNNLMILLA
jgi:Na+-driven multidrug efflux pump